MKKLIYILPAILFTFNYCKKEPAEKPSDVKKIESFLFLAASNPGTIYLNVAGVISNDTIKVDLPNGTNVTALKPEVSYKGASVSPGNNVEQNFSSPVRYTVTAADGSTNSYIVVVRVMSKSKNILSFILKAADNGLAADVAGEISGDTIRVGVASAVNVKSLIPAIVHSGKSIFPQPGRSADFSNPVNYTVTAEDGSTHTYTVVVHQNKALYVGSYDGYVYALDAAMGTLLWKFKTGGRVKASPTYDNGTVFAGSDDTYFYAIDAKSGTLKWKYPTLFKMSTCANVNNGIVYFVNDNFGAFNANVFAVNASTGAEVWRRSMGSGGSSSPVIINDKIYISSFPEGVHCMNKISGSYVKTYQFDGTVGDMAYDNGKLYGSGEIYKGFSIDLSTGAVLWKYYELDTYGGYSSPTIYNGSLITGTFDNQLYSFNLATGAVQWKYKFGNESSKPMAPVAYNGKIYVCHQNGSLYVINAATGQLEWKFYSLGNQPDDPTPKATLANGLVYFGNYEGKIYALDAESGGVKWIYSTTGSVYSGPCITSYSGEIFHSGNSGEHQ